MKSLQIGVARKTPSKIFCIGENCEKTQGLSLNELALMIELDLKRLADKYYEWALSFVIALKPNKYARFGEINVKLIGDDSHAFAILEDEIEQILWSYNKQILAIKDGAFVSRYLRFCYTIHFSKRELSLLKGGRE